MAFTISFGSVIWFLEIALIRACKLVILNVFKVGNSAGASAVGRMLWLPTTFFWAFMGFKMARGTVKLFNQRRGFGFITSEGSDFFFHFKDIKTPNMKVLKNGESVEFVASQGPKGKIAKEVVLVT